MLRVTVLASGKFGLQVIEHVRRSAETVSSVYLSHRSEAHDRLAHEYQLRFGDTSHLIITSVKEAKLRDFLLDRQPDIVLMAGFDQLVPDDLLKIPKMAFLNIHPSLLPRYRGPHAVNWVIVNGESETGVTIHLADPEYDHGPIIGQRRVPIGPDDTAGELFYRRIVPAALDLLEETLVHYRRGEVVTLRQEEHLSSYQPRFKPDAGLVNWHRPANRVYDFIRGMNPKPGAYFLVKGKRLEIGRVSRAERVWPDGVLPGSVLEIDADLSILIATQTEAIRLHTLRAPGGQWVAAAKALPISADYKSSFVTGGNKHGG